MDAAQPLKTENGKHVEMRTELLYNHSEECERILYIVAAISKTWIHSFEPEFRRQNTEWNKPNSRKIVKFRHSVILPKMLIFFNSDINDILKTKLFPGENVIYKDHREWYFTKFISLTIRRKPPECLWVTTLILLDNATTHKFGVVRDVFEWYHLECFKYSPCLLDLSPPNYDMFSKLKKSLSWAHYNDMDERYVAANAVGKVINHGCLATGVRNLLEW